jgi:hypothetical protein
MSSLALFLFGSMVTLLCAAAVGLLLWGAMQDGRAAAERGSGWADEDLSSVTLV